jgi:hypothetical protein
LCATSLEEKEDGQTDDERECGTADDHANDPRLKCSA